VTVRSRTAWTLLFGATFGWVEGAVVVYLRQLYYPDGFDFPLREMATNVLTVELVREAATLLMLLAVACLAGRRFWERAAFFGIAFGIWDLVYYLVLKVTLGWPVTLGDPDILFLLPLPWVAPVYAPVSVAVIMIGAGLAVTWLENQGRRCHPDRWAWFLGGTGIAVLLYSFWQDQAAGMGQAVPQPYPWILLLLGDALLLAGCAREIRAMWQRRTS
jgi:hypothetical protein